MNNKINGLFAVSVVTAAFFFSAPNSFAAPVTGNGTSTFISVFSGATTITGFSDFVFVDSIRRLGILTSSPLSTVSVAGDPPQSSTSTLVLFGGNFIVGGSASGTYLGANPTTFNGDFINFQVASSSKFKVASSGSVTATNLAVTGLGYGVMVASGTAPVASIAPGASGNVLTSNGSTWTSAFPTAASSITSSFIFGENVEAGKAVYMSDGTTNTKAFQIDAGNTLTTSLVSYYKLDSDSNDFWGSNNGTESGVSHPAGKVNNSVSINSTTSSVQFASNFSLSTTGASVAFWVNIPSSRSGQQVNLITNQSGDASTGDIYTNASTQINWFDGTNNNAFTGSTIAYDDAWHHVIIIIRSTSAADIYVDGVLTAYTGRTFASGNIGYLSRNHATFNASGVKFDELGEWSKILSSQEASDLWNSGSGQTMTTKNNGLAGRVYAANATDHVYSDGFIGFSVASTSAGNSGDVVIAGLAKDLFTNLSVGKRYYLSNVTGTISTAPGLITRKVGIVVSTTTIEITNIW